MDKCCRTCKWYENKQCRNSGIGVEVDDIQHYIDLGALYESIVESDIFKKMMFKYKYDFSELGIIKKKVLKDLEAKMEEYDGEYIEEFEEVIGGILRSAFKNIGVNTEIINPESFYCSNWI